MLDQIIVNTLKAAQEKPDRMLHWNEPWNISAHDMKHDRKGTYTLVLVHNDGTKVVLTEDRLPYTEARRLGTRLNKLRETIGFGWKVYMRPTA